MERGAAPGTRQIRANVLAGPAFACRELAPILHRPQHGSQRPRRPI